MNKIFLHPYMKPIVKGFKNKKFLAQTNIILPFLKRSLLKQVDALEVDGWIYIHPHGMDNEAPLNCWIPKLYICLEKEDYWGFIAELLLVDIKNILQWKFCVNLKYLHRPDKIVVYCQHEKDLKEIVKQIRPLLKGKKLHDLRFASSTVQMGIEKKGKGIFVGADPKFLVGVSWRHYRWALEEAIIKENKKKGRLGKNFKSALEKLNINTKNEGPKSFKSNRENVSFIKRIWKEVTDGK